jgi:prevent-host-death family protein
MEHKVNMHEAKTQLSRLVGLVQKGDTVVLAQNGTPVARLTGILPGAYPLAATFGHFRCQRGPQRHFTVEELSESIADSWAGKR